MPLCWSRSSSSSECCAFYLAHQVQLRGLCSVTACLNHAPRDLCPWGALCCSSGWHPCCDKGQLQLNNVWEPVFCQLGVRDGWI